MDDATWLTEKEAAHAMGIAPRTLQQLVKDGKSKLYPYAPQKDRRPRGDGRKPQTVYNRRDVEELVQHARTRVLPPALPSLPGNGHVPVNNLEESFTRLIDQLATIAGKRVPLLLESAEDSTHNAPHEKLYLTIPEAVQVSGLSETLLRLLCRAGKLGFRDGRTWKIAKTDLADSACIAKSAQLLRRSNGQKGRKR